MNAPCKDCPKRHENCHKSCEKYQAFRAWREELNAAKYMEMDTVSCIFESGKRLHRDFLRRRK